MVAKDYNKTKGSSRAEVGEVDTSAPFQSVKDAVSLFGEGAFSGGKPSIKKTRPQSAERVLAKDTQLHLVQKELNKLKEQLKNAETSKAEALVELEKAKRTVEDLTQKLKCVIESKNSAVRSTEVAQHQTNQFAEANRGISPGTNNDSSDMDRESARVDYMAAVAKLDATKQELRKIRQEYETSMEAKDNAAKQAAEADNSGKANMDRGHELSQEIASLHELIQQVNLETARVKEEEKKICADTEKHKLSNKARLEELVKKVLDLKKDTDTEFIKNLETQLGETLSEIEALQNEMENKRGSHGDAAITVPLELDGAKQSLNKVVEEENLLRNLVEALKVELEIIEKEHSESKEKEAETETLAGILHVKLRKAKSELEAALAEEAKIRGASDEMIATIRQLALERENAKHEAEEMKRRIKELKIEAEATRIELEEAENKLRVALNEAEEAKAAEARALDQVQKLSETNGAARSSTSEPGASVTISRDEFESLNRKVEESQKLSELKVEAAIAQVEAVKASEHEALKKLEATQKEIEGMKTARDEALKKAEMAEAAKKAVEGELRRWREREQKKAAEAASRILAETEKFRSSTREYQVQGQKPQDKVIGTKKLEKSKTSVAKKAVLMPSLSSVFHKKKNQV